MPNGSIDGLHRVAANQAVAAASISPKETADTI
jgi:hypothetical protein